MYQDVDDIDEIEEETGAPNKIARLKIIALVLTVIGLLLLVMMFSSISKQRRPLETGQNVEQYKVYTQAISETDPSLRRARLIDFIQTYPRHDRITAAEAQLVVIENADEQDWASVTEVFYDPDQSKPAKLAALELYEDLWGANLLGGRENEIEALKVSIGAIPDPIESDPQAPEKQDFTPKPDRFDDNVSGTIMAGGVIVPERTYNPPVRTPIVNAPRQPRAATIIPPRVRKSRRARYPSRAQRKGVEAEVILALNIDDEGQVQMTELVSVRARKYRKDFIKAAERAALRTKYYPQTIDGKPVATTGLRKRYLFQMD